VALEMAASGGFSGPLVLLAPSFSRQDEAIFLRALDRLARPFGHLPYAAMLKLIGLAVKDSPLPPDRRDALVAELRTNDPRFVRRGIRWYLRYLDRHGSVASRLGEAGAPAWVVHGESGDGGITDEERRTLEACPQITIITIPGASCLSGRGDHVAVGEDHLPGEGPRDAGDNGDPVTASELDRVWRVVDVDVREDVEELLHRGGVRGPPVERLCVPCDVGDHVRVVDHVHRREIAGVEGIVAPFHEREQLCGPAGGPGRVSHEVPVLGRCCHGRVVVALRARFLAGGVVNEGACRSQRGGASVAQAFSVDDDQQSLFMRISTSSLCALTAVVLNAWLV
jgi:hypothetical protein